MIDFNTGNTLKFEDRDRYLSTSMKTIFQFIDADDQKTRIFPFQIEKNPAIKKSLRNLKSDLAMKIVSYDKPIWGVLAEDQVDFYQGFKEKIQQSNPILPHLSPYFLKENPNPKEMEKIGRKTLISWSGY